MNMYMKPSRIEHFDKKLYEVYLKGNLRKYATHVIKLKSNYIFFKSILLLRALRAVYKSMNFYLVLMFS